MPQSEKSAKSPEPHFPKEEEQSVPCKSQYRELGESKSRQELHLSEEQCQSDSMK